MSRAQGADVFDQPEIFLSLGLSLIEQKKSAAAEELIAETLARHPGDPLYENVAHIIRSRKVPFWHAAMLRDQARNAAYRTAIEAAAPGRVVLDIGTGSGLLAMIAARAGAERVVACEANPVVAETARRIVAANGLDHVITIHACHSSKLDRRMIADDGADLVVSEIFAANLVGEGVVGALSHARSELAAPGALFLPEAACLRVALAEYASLPPAPQKVEGFDISAFAPLYIRSGFIEQADTGIALRSDVADLGRMDWSTHDPVPLTGRSQAEVTTTGGEANVILQWLRIEFGGGIVYENPPPVAAAQHWHPIYHTLPECLPTRPGERHAISMFYHTDVMALWTG